MHYSGYLFFKMRLYSGETTVSYAARLREQAMNCEFHDCDERILEHIIQTTDNAELVRKILHKKWTLKQTLEEMQVLDDTSMQVEAMGRQDTNNVSKFKQKKKKTRNKVSNPEQSKDNKKCKNQTWL